MAYATGVAALTGTNATAKRHSHHQHGLDYTPLFRFLPSKVSHQWDNVFSEANARLDRPDPVFWMVALHESDNRDYVVLDENSYYSGLCVDGLINLQKQTPSLKRQSTFPTSIND